MERKKYSLFAIFTSFKLLFRFKFNSKEMVLTKMMVNTLIMNPAIKETIPRMSRTLNRSLKYMNSFILIVFGTWSHIWNVQYKNFRNSQGYNRILLNYCIKNNLPLQRCTLYTVQCTLYNVHCTMYTVQCTLYNVHCTMYTVQCTLCTMYTVYNVHCVKCTQCLVYVL